MKYIVGFSNFGWQTDIRPGITVPILLILSRIAGFLQPWELAALDYGLRWRPSEVRDGHITIVEITEDDIQLGRDNSIPDDKLAVLVENLQAYSPRVIGIDIFRDLPVGEGNEYLHSVLENSNNVVSIDSIKPAIPPPPMLSSDQVGFADAIPDKDGRLRRSFLATHDDADKKRFSLTFQLVKKYVAKDGITIENGRRDPGAMRLGEIEIPRFQSNVGSYVRSKVNGIEVLINFRAGETPFERISYGDVISGNVSGSLLEDRIIIIGYTAESFKDFVSSSSIPNTNPSNVPGILVQAHAISQILSAVYDNRPFLRPLPDPYEYFAIAVSGILGMLLAYWQRKPFLLHLLMTIVFSGILLGGSYYLLIASYWVPIVPIILSFFFNSIVLYPFRLAQRQLKQQTELQLAEREELLDEIFDEIHNKPLQSIALMLRVWSEDQKSLASVRKELVTLDHDLRDIYEKKSRDNLLLREKSCTNKKRKMIIMSLKSRLLSSDLPISKRLENTYRKTIKSTIYSEFFNGDIYLVPEFKPPLKDEGLTEDLKRRLESFLEQAIGNVAKHGKNVKYVRIKCCYKGGDNIVQVTNNGQTQDVIRVNSRKGQGTHFAEKLACKLGGEYQAGVIESRVYRCKLRWPVESVEK